MDDFRTGPSSSQPEIGWHRAQSNDSCSDRKDAAASGVTDCPAHTADGASAPSARFACVAMKFSWSKDRLTAKTVSNFPRHARSVSLSVSEADLRSSTVRPEEILHRSA